MSFIDWLTSNAPSQPTAPWGWCHIATLCLCLAVIVVLARTLRNKSQKAKNITLYILVGLLLVFEIARRVINLCTTTDRSAHNILYILAFRPWCAISSFVLMISIFIKKDWFYNFASTSGLLCTIIFFAYPGVGFRQNYLVFEDIYSIATHSIILILSLTLITLKFTCFDTKSL